ncbi:unnamed protein product [Diamesa tonsa]
MALLGGIIHNFTIQDTIRQKKFTIFKLRMISFPCNSQLYGTLIKIIVYKRYSDFKSLHKARLTRYKNYNLGDFFKTENSYFKRFDKNVLEARKKNILDFLYYCAANPVLYRATPFVSFFENGSETPQDSPMHNKTDLNESQKESVDLLDASFISTSSSFEEIQPQTDVLCTTDITNHQLLESIEDSYSSSFTELETTDDYLFEAASLFSNAVKDEANLRYSLAFENYKLGIDKLLSGAKNDTNIKRKAIAKTKAGKYLERAEILYENHIVNLQEENFVFEDAVTNVPSILALERPMNHLSRFKVVKIMDANMRVQDCTDKKNYIMKAIWKQSSNHSVFLPQQIPYQIPLKNYFQSDNTIFLLLHFASGGLLWDFIIGRSTKVDVRTNIEDIFVEPPYVQSAVELDEEIDDLNYDIEVAEEILVTENYSAINAIYNENREVTPSFDTLSTDMDVNDIMSCSQKLLQSVSKTLQKSHEIHESKIKVPIEPLDEIMTESCTIESIENEMIEPESVPELSTSIEPTTKTNDIPEAVVKQWSTELIVAVHNLHKNGIICGDLNLENLLLGSNGQLLLTYFYKTNRINDQFIPTNPSAIKCLYVSTDVPFTMDSDWYSVGVLIYELLLGIRFFKLHPGGIWNYHELQYPETNIISDEAKDLLHRLIILPAETRLKYDDLIEHPFFANSDWFEIERVGLLNI